MKRGLTLCRRVRDGGISSDGSRFGLPTGPKIQLHWDASIDGQVDRAVGGGTPGGSRNAHRRGASNGDVQRAALRGSGIRVAEIMRADSVRPYGQAGKADRSRAAADRDRTAHGAGAVIELDHTGWRLARGSHTDGESDIRPRRDLRAGHGKFCRRAARAAASSVPTAATKCEAEYADQSERQGCAVGLPAG